MSILIKGMDMPQTCGECIFRDYDYCVLTDKLVEPDDEPLKDCPVISIPPHGRLIDADALIVEINDRIEAAIKWGVNAIADRNGEIKLRAEQAVATFCEASLTAKKIPTIIEAEER